MRSPRLLGKGRSFYHCLSRVVDRQFIFGREEKEFFRKTLRRLEAFLEVRVVNYSIMSNHFHLLLEVPGARVEGDGRGPLSAEELLRKLPLLYDEGKVRQVREQLERARASGSESWEKEILARYEARMGDLSVFMKELKQRFTQWYNRRKKRRGTLWEERFKSVLVEGKEQALLKMAAYIDLNAVRAGLVDDPKDYRWCGYGEAVAGGRLAREGLGRILAAGLEASVEEAAGDWRQTAACYRRLLYCQGGERRGDAYGRGAKRGFSPDAVEKEMAREGQLSLPEVLRCRVRYFSDGVVLGTREFVEEAMRVNGEHLGRKRQRGAHAMRGADWGELHVVRGLRARAIDGDAAVGRETLPVV